MITFLPQWVPQAQFAGYYMAYHKGIYEKYNLHVTIVQGGPEKPPDEYLADGRVDVSSLWLIRGIQLRDRGLMIVNIGQIIQRSALMLAAKKSSEINTLESLKGKRVSLWDDVFGVQARAFFKKYGLHVFILPQGYSVNLFLRGIVDVASVMEYNEYYQILMSGINADELITFSFADFGLGFPEDGLYVLEKTFEKNPQMWNSFVTASLEGWEYAFSHPEETLDVIMDHLRRAHVPTSRVHQRWMLEKMKKLILPDDASAGVLRKKDYEATRETLKDLGIISSTITYDSFYRGKR
jgi:NitT/TauT family transport system substrate-binding protein